MNIAAPMKLFYVNGGRVVFISDFKLLLNTFKFQIRVSYRVFILLLTSIIKRKNLQLLSGRFRCLFQPGLIRRKYSGHGIYL